MKFTSLIAPVVSLVTRERRYGWMDVDRALAAGHLPAQITLDGVEVEDVTVVDDIAGYVVCFVRDSQTTCVVNPEEPDTLLTVRKYGRVRYVPSRVSSLTHEGTR